MGYIKITFVLLLLYNAGSSIIALENHWLTHHINLVFHEAGHVLFMPFGTLLPALGGSLLELFIPLLITIYFFLRREYISSCFGLWWLSTACVSVSRYAADAQERLLPLLGEGNVYHDWHFILSRMNALHLDNTIGTFFLLNAIGACVLMVWIALLDHDIKKITASIKKYVQ